MLQTIAAIVFWLSLLIIFQSYIGILISLLVLRPFIAKKKSAPSTWTGELPRVTVLIPAYNEEKHIQEKLETVIHQDYPREKVRIVVASDCSTDGTNDIVRSFADGGVELVEMNERHGKNGISDALVPTFDTDFVVITDANVMLSPGVLHALIDRFADPGVGVASSNLQPVIPAEGRNLEHEKTYRGFENRIKRLMSEHGMQIGAFGGLYAIRKELFQPFGDKPVHEDIIAPLEIMARGYKVVFTEKAVVYEESEPTISGEFRHRARLTSYNLNTLPRLLRLSAKAGFKALYFAVSYKVTRWLSPYAFLFMLISSLLLARNHWFYAAVAALGCAGLLLALFGWVLDRLRLWGWIATNAYFFVAMNVAGIFGFFRWMKGVKNYWQPRGT